MNRRSFIRTCFASAFCAVATRVLGPVCAPPPLSQQEMWQAIDDVFKQFYLPGLARMLNEPRPLASLLRKRANPAWNAQGG